MIGRGMRFWGTVAVHEHVVVGRVVVGRVVVGDRFW